MEPNLRESGGRITSMGYLGAIMLEAYEYLAGGYLCPKLFTF
jgi:hypothetical protein